jgi:hypothetical protein
MGGLIIITTSCSQDKYPDFIYADCLSAADIEVLNQPVTMDNIELVVGELTDIEFITSDIAVCKATSEKYGHVSFTLSGGEIIDCLSIQATVKVLFFSISLGNAWQNDRYSPISMPNGEQPPWDFSLLKERTIQGIDPDRFRFFAYGDVCDE